MSHPEKPSRPVLHNIMSRPLDVEISTNGATMPTMPAMPFAKPQAPAAPVASAPQQTKSKE